MTLAEFNTLELSKKADLVWEWGHYLTSHKAGNHNVALFLTGDFFTKVYLSLEENTTEDIKGLASENLEPEFKSLLNFEDPFLTRKNNSQTEAA